MNKRNYNFKNLAQNFNSIRIEYKNKIFTRDEVLGILKKAQIPYFYDFFNYLKSNDYLLEDYNQYNKNAKDFMFTDKPLYYQELEQHYKIEAKKRLNYTNNKKKELPEKTKKIPEKMQEEVVQLSTDFDTIKELILKGVSDDTIKSIFKNKFAN